LFRKLSLKRSDKFLQDFLGYILQYAIHPNEEIMSKTCFFVFYIAKIAFDVHKNLKRVKHAIITSLYRKGWIVSLKQYEINFCCQIIRKAQDYCTKETDTDFHQQLLSIIDSTNDLFVVFGELSKMRSQKEHCDFARYEEKLNETSGAYYKIPEIRLNWIKKLTKHHQVRKNNVETAECFLKLCSIIEEDFDDVTIARRGFEPIDEKIKEKEQSNIENYMDNANQYFQKGEFLERSTILCMEQLLPLLLEGKKWQKLAFTHRVMSKTYERLASE
ncbi:hypothetical protein MHBO_004154, partial [Bonamia ostreae]